MNGDNQNMNQAPTNPPTSYSTPPSKSEGVGPVVGIIIVLVVIVLGGLYFWNQRKAVQPAVQQTVPTTDVGSSDSTASIQTDLTNVQVDNIDSELNAQ